MMMIYGLFVFSLKSAPYQTMSENKSWRHPEQQRIGLPPSLQFLGKDGTSLDLNGTLLPEVTGGKASLEMLEYMADQGDPWPLITGNGDFKGWFVITSLNRTYTEFFKDGSARKIDFSISFKRVEKPENINPIKLLDLI